MIKEILNEALAVNRHIFEDQAFLDKIDQCVDIITSALRSGGKILFCGNGGSAADAQHLAAELSGKFYLDRPPLSAEACHVNTSFLTAVSNDYSFESAYARYIEGVAHTGDVLVAISTSGNSGNIVKAATQAHKQGLKVVGMTGKSGGELLQHSDILLNFPSENTPRIQEAHILIGHIICEQVEKNLFPQ